VSVLIAVNYHYLRPRFDGPYAGIHGSTPEQFRDQLEMLGQLGEFVAPDRVRAAIHGRANLPEVAVLITFDDGLREQWEFAWPVLHGASVPAIFFVNTGPIEDHTVSVVHKIHLLRSQIPPAEFARYIAERLGRETLESGQFFDEQAAQRQYRYDDDETARLKYLLNFGLEPTFRDAMIHELFQEVFTCEASVSKQLYMGREEISSLAEFEAVGSHAHQHAPLARCSMDEAATLVGDSVDWIEQKTGFRPYALSYPYGTRTSVDRRVAEEAKRQGIEFAFTTERAANLDLRRPLFLARFDSNDVPGGKACSDSPATFIARLPFSDWDDGG